MRKYYSILLLLLLVCVNTVFAQNPEIKTDLPTVIPPSPTVAALMKFEEVPVSNYTGIPDVSVPLFNTTGKFGLDVNVALSYHPSSVKVNEVAGVCGLGWSLIAGGSIARTVRDIPDEEYRQTGMFNSKKIGIYHNDSSFVPDNNNFYEVMPLFDADYLFNLENPDMNRFMFEANEKGKFDTKHDLYQFNFMGYSGRFIIEKKPNGTYEVVKLEKNNLIINYNHSNRTFEIKDTKGFTFLFDVKELSSSNALTVTTLVAFGGDENWVDYDDYISAFHLSKVFYNEQLVVEFVFNEGFFNEGQLSANETYNLPILPSLTLITSVAQANFGDNHEAITKGILPLSSRTTTELSVKTKKITQIKIIDKAKIDFDILTDGRNDVLIPASSPYINKIIVRDWNDTIRKEYKLDYDFERKMFLKEIKEGSSTNQMSKYKFIYDKIVEEPTHYDEDYWGYLKLDALCHDIQTIKRDTDLVNCKKNVLKQIIYPTNGSVVFEYESNTYSYVGDFSVPDDMQQLDYFESFESSPANNTVTSDVYNITLDNDLGNGYIGNQTAMPTGSKNQTLGVFSTARNLTFNIDTNVPENELAPLYVVKVGSSPLEQYPIRSGGCEPVTLTLSGGYEYALRFEWNSNTVLLYNNISISETSRNTDLKRWLYGGGIRIKNIYYTNHDAPEIETQDFPNTFSRKINYNYNFFNDVYRSSGALVFPKPVMNYEMTRDFDYMATSAPSPGIFAYGEVIYQVSTKANNLSFISTKGGDVGYKNVTVSQTGNGRTEYVYTSPIDYPEIINSRTVVYPYAPTPNIDYKRGLLTKMSKYDQSNRVVSRDSTNYIFENYEKITGVTLFYLSKGCPYASKYINYDNYRAGVLDPNTYICGSSGGFPVICGSLLNWNARGCGDYVSSFVGRYLLKEAFGWAKLDSTISKNYFYDANGNQSNIENSVLYTYNSNNMQFASQTSSTSTTGVDIEKKYYYTINSEVDSEPQVTALRNNNMVEIPLKIETFKNAVKLSEQKTIYKDWGNGLLAPEIIQTSKGTLPLENRIRYSQLDNTNGNPLELQQEGGTVVCYIWGYNKTQPIAKIENSVYNSIPSNLITAAQNASDAVSNEINLINALNAIRSALPNSMVTTYTYKPLVGVSTITDPKGDTTTYIYDEFGRLKEVRDKDNNILSENEYHYKTQN